MARTTTKLTSVEAVVKVLARGPKRGLTAEAISERAGIKLSTTRTTLSGLRGAGTVYVVGREDATFGRPANRYALSA